MVCGRFGPGEVPQQIISSVDGRTFLLRPFMHFQIARDKSEAGGFWLAGLSARSYFN